MSLHCPFCHASEDERLEANDEKGEEVVLVMFDCPFYYRFYKNQVSLDAEMQKILQEWRNENGEDWLLNVGPIMKKRELRNIERYKTSLFERY